MDRRHFVGAAFVPWLAGAVRAQSGATRVFVGFPPGGAADTTARLLTAHYRPEGGVSVVENRPGAGGRLAVDAVKYAAADGNSLLITPGSILTIYPFVYAKLNYNSTRDLQPITPLCSVPYGISVGPMVPASVKTMKDFAAWCKANTSQASYGSPGSGTTPHFVGAMFAKETGISYQHVPYRGGAPALQDVMGGQIASSVNVVSELVSAAQAGKVRVLAVSSAERLPQLPGVPTFTEAGFGGLQSSEWFGLFAPAATPASAVARINKAAIEIFSMPEVKKAMNDIAFSTTTSTPEAFAALLRSDLERWGPVVKSTGFRIED